MSSKACPECDRICDGYAPSGDRCKDLQCGKGPCAECRAKTEAPRIPLIQNCARCKGTHTDVALTRFTHLPEDDAGNVLYHAWAPCPTNGEPILVKWELTDG